MAELLPLAADPHLTAGPVPFRVAEQAQGQLGPAGAHQACNADDLAFPDSEVHIVQDLSSQRWIEGVPVLHLEHDLSAPLRADDEDFDALLHQCFYVSLFLGRVALAEHDLDVVAGRAEGILEAFLILDPAWFILGWEDDPDDGVARRRRRL